MTTINFSDQIKAAKEKKTLNKPFRTPGGPKKFSVYTKNEKGNVVKVNFGDPNMEIKRDNPQRRKNFRARHHCENPGPKWKARYWSCYQWRAGAPVKASEEVEINLETEAAKGLWYNIQKKKERLGQNYKPAKPGDKDYPKQDALKKAQAEEEEWDGVSYWKQEELLKIWPELAKADDIPVEDDPEEMNYHSEDNAEMAVIQLSSTIDKLTQIIEAIRSRPDVALEVSEPWITGKIAIIEDYANAVHSYLIYPKEGLASENGIESYESEDDYKSTYQTEGKNFKDFLQKCIPSKQGSDKEKFQSCLLEYKKAQAAKAALFQPPLILNKHNEKIVDQAYKTIVEPSFEKEHGEKKGAFTEDDMEYQQEYEKTVHPDYPTKNMITKDKIFTKEELNKDLKEYPGNSKR